MEILAIVGGTMLITFSVAAIGVWIVKVCDSCNHSYERMDTCNDKKMILVCRRCGKIKKLRK